jgi:histidinol-phosphate aminotransferase
MAQTSLVSRRSFMRIAGTAAAAMPILAESPGALAVDTQSRHSNFGNPPSRMHDANAVIISGNENPLGPSAGALQAMMAAMRQGGRYHNESKDQAIAAFSSSFDLKPEYVSLWPGSTPALDLALKWNIGPGKPLVVASPSYEQGPRAAEDMKAQVISVPLTAHGAHDVRKMVAAAPNAGIYYIVNPNNPTGTMTPKQDIIWLLKNKVPGSVVIVDEAYHHFSNDESVVDLVGKDQDLMVTRTFSKIYGMAGLRAGLYIAKPEYQAKLATLGPAATQPSGGAMEVSMATAHACTAGITDKTLIPTRRKINADIREATLEWMDKRNYKFYPGSQANFFMVDVRRPGREFAALMQQQDVYIGRTWPVMPTYVRITVGTAEEMKKFQVAFAKAYDTTPSVAHRDLPYNAPSELRYA